MKKILMCRPDYFGVDYDINPWMSNNIGNVDPILAITQWEKLYKAIKKVVDVELIKPVEGLPDMVFTANAGFYNKHTKTVLLSKFRNEQRKGEEVHFFKWFTEHGYCVFQGNELFEGEGDLLKDVYGQHWIGFGFRSSDAVKKTWPFNEISNLKKLELVDNRFYHLDTCFAPLRIDGAVLWFPGAFSEKSQEKIRKHTNSKYNIEVTEEEALTFCCNAVVIDKNIFIPNCPSVAKRLTELGFKVHQFDLSEFLKSGGAAKCLTMYL